MEQQARAIAAVVEATARARKQGVEGQATVYVTPATPRREDSTPLTMAGEDLVGYMS